VVRAFHDLGFYVFENAIATDELAELQADVYRILERAPQGPDATVDCKGRPLLPEFSDRTDRRHTERRGGGTHFGFAKPLSDPDGGRGRSPGKMVEGVAPEGAPEHILRHASAFCLFSEPGLRLYGHPGLLAVAASVCGEDFVPSGMTSVLCSWYILWLLMCWVNGLSGGTHAAGGGESIQIKLPGLGPSVAWHQDGTTHWGEEGGPPTSLDDAMKGEGLWYHCSWHPLACAVRLPVGLTGLDLAGISATVSTTWLRSLAATNTMLCGCCRDRTARPVLISLPCCLCTAATFFRMRCRWCGHPHSTPCCENDKWHG
jgi:hypothetical protein